MDSDNFTDVTCHVNIYVYGRGFVWFQLCTLPLEHPETCVVVTVLGRWVAGMLPVWSCVCAHLVFSLRFVLSSSWALDTLPPPNLSEVNIYSVQSPEV